MKLENIAKNGTMTLRFEMLFKTSPIDQMSITMYLNGKSQQTQHGTNVIRNMPIPSESVSHLVDCNRTFVQPVLAISIENIVDFNLAVDDAAAQKNVFCQAILSAWQHTVQQYNMFSADTQYAHNAYVQTTKKLLKHFCNTTIQDITGVLMQPILTTPQATNANKRHDNQKQTSAPTYKTCYPAVFFIITSSPDSLHNEMFHAARQNISAEDMRNDLLAGSFQEARYLDHCLYNGMNIFSRVEMSKRTDLWYTFTSHLNAGKGHTKLTPEHLDMILPQFGSLILRTNPASKLFSSLTSTSTHVSSSKQINDGGTSLTVRSSAKYGRESQDHVQRKRHAESLWTTGGNNEVDAQHPPTQQRMLPVSMHIHAFQEMLVLPKKLLVSLLELESTSDVPAEKMKLTMPPKKRAAFYKKDAAHDQFITVLRYCSNTIKKCCDAAKNMAPLLSEWQDCLTHLEQCLNMVNGAIITNTDGKALYMQNKKTQDSSDDTADKIPAMLELCNDKIAQVCKIPELRPTINDISHNTIAIRQSSYTAISSASSVVMHHPQSTDDIPNKVLDQSRHNPLKINTTRHNLKYDR